MASVNSIYCPKCKQRTSLTDKTYYDEHPIRYAITECNGDGCAQFFLVIRHISAGKILKIYPNALPGKVDDIIQDPIKTDFEEALLCESAGAYRGAATLARRTLQVICLDKGASAGKKLHEQIDELFANGVITGDIKDWAHEVRFVGNDAAHPNETDVSADDARDILELLDSMCDVLYVAPARAAKRKAKRTVADNVDEN